MISLTVAANSLLDAIAAAGGDPDRIIASVGLTRPAFSNPEGFIPFVLYARILEEAARSTDDDCFGLHWGASCDPRCIGPLAYVVLNSPTIGTALDNTARYNRVHNEASLWFCTEEGSRCFIRQSLQRLGAEWPGRCRQSSEGILAGVLGILRMMAGSRWGPREVQFAHQPPRLASEHIRIFGAPVSFGHETNALIVDREFLDRQVPAADPFLYPTLKRYLDQVLEEMPREDDLMTATRKAVAESMRDGDCLLAVVAKRLAMSPRTLQRSLKDYGTDFKALVDDTRRRFSLNYLKDANHTLTEVAFLLGYSEVSAFNRAFKRWIGSTPMEHRRKLRPDRN